MTPGAAESLPQGPGPAAARPRAAHGVEREGAAAPGAPGPAGQLRKVCLGSYKRGGKAWSPGGIAVEQLRGKPRARSFLLLPKPP